MSSELACLARFAKGVGQSDSVSTDVPSSSPKIGLDEVDRQAARVGGQAETGRGRSMSGLRAMAGMEDTDVRTLARKGVPFW